MSRKTLNVIIGIVFAFIVIFFAGSSAYEQYRNRLSDEQAQLSQEEQDALAKENQSGQTNEEVRL